MPLYLLSGNKFRGPGGFGGILLQGCRLHPSSRPLEPVLCLPVTTTVETQWSPKVPKIKQYIIQSNQMNIKDGRKAYLNLLSRLLAGSVHSRASNSIQSSCVCSLAVLRDPCNQSKGSLAQKQPHFQLCDNCIWAFLQLGCTSGKIGTRSF